MKSLLGKRRKNLLYVSPILLLTISIIIASLARAQPPATVLYVDPLYTEEPEPGESFLVAIKVANVTDPPGPATGMYGAEFKLSYNSTLISATSVVAGPIFTTKNYFAAQLNVSVPGVVWFMCTLVPPSTAFTGDGVVATINFTALAVDTTVLHLIEDTTKLADNTTPIPQPINHTTLDADVTVVPEFPATLIMPLFLIATLAAVITGKIVWSRRLRGPTFA